MKRTFSSTTDARLAVLEHAAKGVFKPLSRTAPVFYTQGSRVMPLFEPSDFYKELKKRILSAKDNIFLATLYIGQSEKELVDTIRTALENSDTLKVHILVDCLRGTRASQSQSSATLLLPLIRDFPAGRVQVSMYHTPDLKGILKKALPQRFNESIGLMHLKVYGFDDAVMLSGANLSTDYFTNRQDRYIVFDQQPELAKYYHNLINLVGSFSYQLGLPQPTQESYSLTMPSSMPDPVCQSTQFKAKVRSRLENFIADAMTETKKNDSEDDTAVLPVIQMGPFGIRQDEKMTLELLEIVHRQGKSKDSWWTIHLTSGYFNFTDRYKAFILRTQARFQFITASPEANGFFNSRGVSRFLPPAYTHIERQFYRQVTRANKQDVISIEEYKRSGWTYHAKGLWVCLANQVWPSVTMIGSPNFGHRSSNRDLEAQAVVITKSKELQESLHKEVNRLHEYSSAVSSETFKKQDRRVPYGVKLATAMVKTML
ncbi:hypothetical protein J3Q64DRAFT_1649246 [Phycomyces blakesleeanus]|uniref:CDP-diacylglycerol--glycerol-3-phosphate 3-phosphatidyltransferase n=2 Tax=Phycomyces blakesleeanus TaxID=4837 RepID=A0A167LAI0_PHYB8|nr:hypothetical protein PHYBLDRAFT_15584 [Phycomyces blakesleeanus NRRL 1555(-)]OAD69988.1 hypothetical protein PHYBLDRAFT_15584 [Phycomyces blakesleeanus NRRL 1555(-)]|eukprot:XP_018288028.1 hypothetical protein PHYBLDRAFT_15584 [Phycomyces blakesleeanus NRRL 1555(-)]